MTEQEDTLTVEVSIPVTVRVTVGEGGVPAALDLAWSVANGLDAHPLSEEVWASGLDVGLDVPTYAGNAVLLDEGGSLLEELL